MYYITYFKSYLRFSKYSRDHYCDMFKGEYDLLEGVHDIFEGVHGILEMFYDIFEDLK